MEEIKTPTAPAEALVKLERLNPETINHIVGLLEKDVVPNLQADVSNYAKGRMRVWLPYEAPLDSPQLFNRPFVPGLLHDELWQFIVDLCAKHGFTAQVALASKGGSIKPHRDTTYAAEWSFAINLGECDWSISSSRDLAKPDYSMHLKGGEVFKFNCKHVHSVSNVAPNRWAINVWAIASTNAARKVNIDQRLQTMLDENPQVAEFIDKHKPTTDGEVKPMKQETPQQKLKRLTQEPQPQPQPQQKGDQVISYINDCFHVVTNNPTPEEAKGYQQAMKTGKPFKMGKTIRKGGNGEYTHNLWLMPILTGDTYHYGLLEKMLSSRGKSFTLTMVKNSELKTWMEKDGGNVQDLVSNSNFAWANTEHSFFLKTRLDNTWTLEDLGLIVYNMKKTPKRLQEIPRFTQIYTKSSENKLTVDVWTDKRMEEYYQHYGMSYNPATEQVMFDGPIMMRKTAFVKMCLSIKDTSARRRMIWIAHNDPQPFIARYISSDGLIKGMLILVEDVDISADIVCHEANLKKEMFIDDNGFSFVAWPLDSLYEVTWDDQSKINNPWLYTQERFNLELDSLLEDFKAEVEKGEIPQWMLTNPTAQSEESNGVTNENNELQEWQANYEKWQEAGYSLYDSSNFMHLAFGQLSNRMSSSLRNQRMWLPMSNAFLAPVITYEALQILGGLNLPSDKADVVWYDKRFGAVIPGDRFAETADLHDTWDQDGDMARFIRIKLWCSDLKINNIMAEHAVIARNLVLPTTPEEAIDMVVIVRSPNGPGGYSIELYDEFTMPFMRVKEEFVQVIDLANATLPMPVLFANTTTSDELTNILKEAQYSRDEMTADNALDMINAQLNNPGFGSFVNCLMVRSAVFGPSYPANMPANGNDIIDTTAQTANIDAFVFIKDSVSQMWDQLFDDIVDSGKEVDAYLVDRMPKLWREQLADVDFPLCDGPFTQMNIKYKQVLKDIQAETQATMHLRSRSELIVKLQEAIPTLSDSYQAVFEDFYSRHMRKIRVWDEKKTERKAEEAESNSRYFKAWNAVFTSNELEGLVNDMVSEVNTFAKDKNIDPNKFVVALYRWLTDPKMCYVKAWHEGRGEYVKSTSNLRYGMVDRIIFQAGKRGQVTLMDMLIQGLKNMGL